MTVSFSEPSIAPVQATGTVRPRRANVARVIFELIVPSRNVAGKSIMAGMIVLTGVSGTVTGVSVEPTGVTRPTSMSNERLPALPAASLVRTSIVCGPVPVIVNGPVPSAALGTPGARFSTRTLRYCMMSAVLWFWSPM